MMNTKTLWLRSLTLMLILVCVTPLVNSQETDVPTPLAPSIEVAAQMDAVPSNCGILAKPTAIDPLIPHAIGTWPVWVGVPDADDNSKGIMFVPNEHYQRNRQLEGWWSTKVGWFVSPSYTGEVKIQAYNLADNSPMYFDSSQDLSTTMTLNSAKPGGFVTGLDNWAFFPSNVWVSKAGCYRLEAEWDGGLWQQVIAVGNLDI